MVVVVLLELGEGGGRKRERVLRDVFKGKKRGGGTSVRKTN